MGKLITEKVPANDRTVERAAGLLAAGGLVAFPTDTVYGLGASVDRLDAVEALYRVKGRPVDKPFALLIGNSIEAGRYARSWPASAAKLAAAFWPGPLTLVLPKAESLPDIVVAGGDTVALRVPGHAIARGLVLALGSAIAAPSANLSEMPAPGNASAVMQQLAGRIPLVLDGGPSRYGKASTVVIVQDDGAVRVLREGAVSRAMLAELVEVVGAAPQPAGRA